MTLTQRPIQAESLPAALAALGSYETPLNGRIRAVFTRQTLGPWTYYIGQCVLAGGAGPNSAEVYKNFAFVSMGVDQRTIKSLLADLAVDGIRMPHGLPSIRIPHGIQNWEEDIIPSHAGHSKLAFRRFTVSIESNAFFPDAQLIDYELPYRPSATAYVKEFLSFEAFHDVNDGRRGQFIIDIPDRRGAIRCAGNILSINTPTIPLRLTGTLDGAVVDLRDSNVFEYDDKTPHDLDLWLLTADSEIVDFLSTSYWPHQYERAVAEQERGERYAELVRQGESELCEFKEWIDLHHEKASDLEKTVCALSNQKGGTMFIGVTDEGDIVGIASKVARRGEDPASAIAAYAASIRNRLSEALKDNQCFGLAVESVSGTSLIVVAVQKSRDINFIVRSEHSKIAFIRHGATSMKLTPPEMKAMIETELAQRRT
jgi:Putative DNA-binding domain